MTSGTQPKISVIVPVYNGQRFLFSALGSSVSQDQGDALEVIVVDDGSTDTSIRVAENYQRVMPGKVTIASQTNAGPAAARNHGLSVASASSEFIAFLDADDLWPHGALALQLTHMEREQCDIVLGKTQCFRVAERTTVTELIGLPAWLFQLGSGLYRKTVFTRIGDFDISMRLGEDVDWFLRARESGVSLYLSDEVSLWYRRHPESLTAKREAGMSGLTAALRNSLQRRRAGQAVAPPLPAWQHVSQEPPPEAAE